MGDSVIGGVQCSSTSAESTLAVPTDHAVPSTEGRCTPCSTTYMLLVNCYGRAHTEEGRSCRCMDPA